MSHWITKSSYLLTEDRPWPLMRALILQDSIPKRSAGPIYVRNSSLPALLMTEMTVINLGGHKSNK